MLTVEKRLWGVRIAVPGVRGLLLDRVARRRTRRAGDTPKET